MACEHNKFTSITDGNEFEWCRYFPNNYFGRGGSTSLSGTSTSTSSYVYTKSSASNSGAQEGCHTNNGPNSNNGIKLASQIFINNSPLCSVCRWQALPFFYFSQASYFSHSRISLAFFTLSGSGLFVSLRGYSIPSSLYLIIPKL